MIVFSRKKDGLYHLEVDGKNHGYLDGNEEDSEFKIMLSKIFEDVGCQADVVVLPSKGESFFFDDTVAVYQTYDEFMEACKSRGAIEYLKEYEKLI